MHPAQLRRADTLPQHFERPAAHVGAQSESVPRPGKRIGDIGHAIQEYAESRGYGVVRQYVGHAIGRKIHEDPQVPNFGDPGTGTLLRKGMVLTIEPMLTVGTYETHTLADKWTVVTNDGKRAAQFEHTVAITDGDPEILTLP